MACKELSREGSQVPPNAGLFTHGMDSLFLLFSFLSPPLLLLLLPSPFPLLPLLLLLFFSLLLLPSIYITNTVTAGGNNHSVAKNLKVEVDSGKVGTVVRGLDKPRLPTFMFILLVRKSSTYLM